ncbi:protein-L-isoaspartate(D-aspartate) O-methyltransferase [candidate division KSB1 bacterium]|nr:protein-L-isoaspartate(D-aspartate) O-methyltransferase [candidate division KSB1 bacterium]
MKRMVNIFVLTCLFFSCSENGNGKDNQEKKTDKDIYTARRYEMVKRQIQWRGVKDSLVLKAMREVPRHKFVPPDLKDVAYLDRPLPIGERQTISQPYIVALMTEYLGLNGGEKVLEIGTGSGYQAAVLGEIAKEVYSIEIISSLGLTAKKKLKEMGYENIHVKIGDGYLGWPEKAPFDGVIVTAAPNHIPQPLIDQLKPGGKMIIPVGDYYQELILITKSETGKVIKKSVLPVVFVPMTGKAQKK